MKRIHSGTAVPRHQVFFLEDGNPVVQWTEFHVQELLSGEYRAFNISMFGHPAGDSELEQLKAAGIVEEFTRQYVWLYALPEQNRFGELHTIDGNGNALRVFYINTTLPETEEGNIRDLLKSAGLGEKVDVKLRGGMVVIFAKGGKPYRHLEEAEALQRQLTGLSSLFNESVIAFFEGDDARRTTSELNALKVQLESAEPELGFDELAASQHATSITEGKCAIIASSSEHNLQSAVDGLAKLHMQLRVARTAAEALEIMEQMEQDCPPSILVIDMELDGIHGWQLLRKAREIPALAQVPVIAVTGIDMSDADQALALKVAGVQALLESPINEARLRLHVYEILQTQERQT